MEDEKKKDESKDRKLRGRVMCLDVGEKRIGIALSDALGLTAQPFQTLRRESIERDLNALHRIAHECGVSCVVVGLPINMNGTMGREAQRVRGFSERIEAYLGMKVIHWDERLSTVAAEQVLRQAGLTAVERRKHVDKVAAAVILQSYLDSGQGRAPCSGRDGEPRKG